MRVTKEMVVAGSLYREDLPIDEFGGAVRIRPLTSGEMGRVQATTLQGLSATAIKELPRLAVRLAAATGGGDFDIGLSPEDVIQVRENDRAGDCLAVACALSCDGEDWCVKDVDRMPPGVPEKIAARVFAISGASREGVDAARKFRAVARGDDDPGAAPGGHTAGHDAGSNDSAPGIRYDGNAESGS